MRRDRGGPRRRDREGGGAIEGEEEEQAEQEEQDDATVGLGLVVYHAEGAGHLPHRLTYVGVRGEKYSY